MHKLTDEQEAIRAATVDSQDSLMISAYAGCGKTSTLEMLAPLLRPVPTLALAFNVKIKKELERRLPSNFTVLTMNGLGHRAWARALRATPLKMDDKKLGRLITATAKKGGLPLDTDQWNAIRELVSRAMQVGITPEATRKGWVEDTEENWGQLAEDNWIECTPAMIEIARRVLREHVRESLEGIISFDDQLYMPIFFGTAGCWPQFAQGLIDEAQDLSAINHEQVKRAIPQGRLVVCGDPKQAIYQFRGADGQSMGTMRALRSAWIDLPLVTTFRCPKVVVERQQGHAPGFMAFESAPQGEFIRLPPPMRPEPGNDGRPTPIVDARNATWRWDSSGDLSGSRQVAILCRNNAPLVSMAFKLIRTGQAVQMLGRDIGKGLVTLAKKLSKNDGTSAEEFRALLDSWRTTERSKAVANDDQGKIAGIEDRAECLLAVLDEAGAKTVRELVKRLTDLFESGNARITLSTGHRAKGLEWPVVLHLDPWRIPSKYAMSNPVQMEQEKNLKYVIETRAQSVLIEASLDKFEI